MTLTRNMSESLRRVVMAGLLAILYVFLYMPIGYVIYASFSEDIVWPFPPSFTLSGYDDLFANSLYYDALKNSLIIGSGSGALSALISSTSMRGSNATNASRTV